MILKPEHALMLNGLAQCSDCAVGDYQRSHPECPACCIAPHESELIVMFVHPDVWIEDRQKRAVIEIPSAWPGDEARDFDERKGLAQRVLRAQTGSGSDSAREASGIVGQERSDKENPQLVEGGCVGAGDCCNS